MKRTRPLMTKSEARRLKAQGREVTQLENSHEVILCHALDNCEGERCPIHKRTDHSMRSFPQHWRGDRHIIERICPCGIGHPDPDDPTEYRVHGCCGVKGHCA